MDIVYAIVGSILGCIYSGLVVRTILRKFLPSSDPSNPFYLEAVGDNDLRKHVYIQVSWVLTGVVVITILNIAHVLGACWLTEQYLQTIGSRPDLYFIALLIELGFFAGMVSASHLENLNDSQNDSQSDRRYAKRVHLAGHVWYAFFTHTLLGTVCMYLAS